jgi:hypothetical protein
VIEDEDLAPLDGASRFPLPARGRIRQRRLLVLGRPP